MSLLTVTSTVFSYPGSLYIERMKYKTGPSTCYLCWKPDISTFCLDSKSAIKFAKWPASTPTGAALREWLKEAETPVAEPNDNTPMII